MRSLLTILVVAATFLAASPAEAQQTGRAFLIKVTPEADRGLRVVSNKQGVSTGIASVDDLNKRHQAVEMVRVFADAGKFEARHREFGLHRWYRVTMSKPEALDNILAEYQKNGSVERAERIVTRRLFPSDRLPLRLRQ